MGESVRQRGRGMGDDNDVGDRCGLLRSLSYTLLSGVHTDDPGQLRPPQVLTGEEVLL